MNSPPSETVTEVQLYLEFFMSLLPVFVGKSSPMHERRLLEERILAKAAIRGLAGVRTSGPRRALNISANTLSFFFTLRIEYSDDQLSIPRVNLSIYHNTVSRVPRIIFHLFGHPQFRGLDSLPTLFGDPVSIQVYKAPPKIFQPQDLLDELSSGKHEVRLLAMPATLLAAIAKIKGRPISFRVLPGDTRDRAAATILKAVVSHMRDNGLHVDMRDRKDLAATELHKRGIKKKDLADLATRWTQQNYKNVYEARQPNYVRGPANAGWGYRAVKASSVDLPSIRTGETVNESLARIMRTSALRAPQTPPGMERPRYLYRGMHEIDISRGYLDWPSYIATSYNPVMASHFSKGEGQSIVFAFDLDDVPAGTPWIWFANPTEPEKFHRITSTAEESEVLLPPGRIVAIPRFADVAEAKKAVRQMVMKQNGFSHKRKRESPAWGLQLGGHTARVFRKAVPWRGAAIEAADLVRVLSDVPKTKIGDFWSTAENSSTDSGRKATLWLTLMMLGTAHREMSLFADVPAGGWVMQHLHLVDGGENARKIVRQIDSVRAMYVPDLRATSVSNPSAPIVRSLYPKLDSNNAN